MKKSMFIVSLCVVALLVAMTVQAQDASYDANAKFWKEKFKGGAAGAPGNVLMAVGRGFHFNQAKLQSVVPVIPADTIDMEPDCTGYDYESTYMYGKLTLNSKGPWLRRGKLRDKAVTAVNCSTFDHDTGLLHYLLTFGGEFNNRPGTCYEVVAEYEGVPEFKFDEEGSPVFQRGDGKDMDIQIRIYDCPIE